MKTDLIMGPSNFQLAAAKCAIQKMFNGDKFYVCDVDDAATAIGRKGYICNADRSALRALHCMTWGDMGPELAAMVRSKCVEWLGFDEAVPMVDEVQPEKGGFFPLKFKRVA